MVANTVVSDQGNMVYLHRGLPTGIYTTSTAEECHFVANDCKANIIVVEDQNQLNKILEVTYLATYSKETVKQSSPCQTKLIFCFWFSKLPGRLSFCTSNPR